MSTKNEVAKSKTQILRRNFKFIKNSADLDQSPHLRYPRARLAGRFRQPVVAVYGSKSIIHEFDPW